MWLERSPWALGLQRYGITGGFDRQQLGIEPISLTNRQLRNAVEFDAFAKLLAARLGKQLRFRSRQYQAAQRELRDLLPGKF